MSVAIIKTYNVLGPFWSLREQHELECEHRLLQCKLCGDDQKVYEMEVM